MRQSYSPVKYSSVLAPVINIGLGTPLTIKDDLKYFKALIDTGYDGTVLISQDIFIELGLMAFKIPMSMTATAEFITGEKITMKSAEGLLYIADLNMEYIVNIDAVNKVNEILIGRQILEELYLILEGPEKEYLLTVQRMN